MADDAPVITELDGPWKDVLDLAPQLALTRLWPDAVGVINWAVDYQSLDVELQRLTPEDRETVRRVDRLLLFEKLDGDPLYLHVEVHCYRDRGLGRRVMTYRHRLRGRFGKAPVTLIVFGDDGRRRKPRGHREGELGSTDVCRWVAVKLRDFEDDLPALEAGENVFDLFLAAHLLTRRTHRDYEARAEHKLRLLSNLMDRKVEDRAAWFRVIDWIMALPSALNDRVHLGLSARRKEPTVAYVSHWQQKGEVIGQIRLSQKLLKMEQTPTNELAMRPWEELTRLQEELEARLLPPADAPQPGQ